MWALVMIAIILTVIVSKPLGIPKWVIQALLIFVVIFVVVNFIRLVLDIKRNMLRGNSESDSPERWRGEHIPNGRPKTPLNRQKGDSV